jgi:hypothetical protein
MDSAISTLLSFNFYMLSFIGEGALNSLISAVLSINFQLIFQLTSLALIVISGPVIIFLLSASSGDL